MERVVFSFGIKCVPAAAEVISFRLFCGVAALINTSRDDDYDAGEFVVLFLRARNKFDGQIQVISASV